MRLVEISGDISALRPSAWALQSRPVGPPSPWCCSVHSVPLEKKCNVMLSRPAVRSEKAVCGGLRCCCCKRCCEARWAGRTRTFPSWRGLADTLVREPSSRSRSHGNQRAHSSSSNLRVTVSAPSSLRPVPRQGGFPGPSERPTSGDLIACIWRGRESTNVAVVPDRTNVSFQKRELRSPAKIVRSATS